MLRATSYILDVVEPECSHRRIPELLTPVTKRQWILAAYYALVEFTRATNAKQSPNEPRVIFG